MKKLTEGGNIWKNESSDIKKEEIEPTLINFALDFDIPYEILRNSLLGGTLKNEKSGDIDLGLHPSLRRKIEKRLMDLPYKRKFSGDTIHILYPISGRDNEYVQIDIIFGNPEFLKTFYVSPEEKEFKGIHRNILLSVISRYTDREESSEKDLFGRPKWEKRWKWSPKEGLVYVLRKSVERDGKIMKKREEIKLKDGIKDKNRIAKILLGNDAKGEDLDSIRRILFLLKKNRPDIYPLVIRDWKKEMEEKGYSLDLDVFETASVGAVSSGSIATGGNRKIINIIRRNPYF